MKSVIASAAVAALLLAGSAQAASLTLAADLAGANEVPANTTAGKGHVDATLDTTTNILTYTVRYSGLSGAPTMAHFHGPAAAGVNAPPIVTVNVQGIPMRGASTLTAAQVADIKAGNWYFNIHTAAHPGGEIRGQVQVKK
jgi:hypothetical protein